MTSLKVKIAARLRPRIQGEQDDGLVQIQDASESEGGGMCITVPNPRDPTQMFRFPFTSCYGPNSTQEEVFERDCKPLVDVVFTGVTVTIFAYGVTSSGKTFTMQGSKAEPGVIPRVVQEMFDKKDIPGYETELSVSYMEIYKDECYDLLVQRENAPKLPVRENEHGMVFVANLSSIPLGSMEEFDHIYTNATKHRSVGSTNLNRASSRSHAILTIEAKMVDRAAQTTLVGKINLVDLAGSENNKLTGNDPSRMAESAAINKSLSVLGQVVHSLNQGASRIPYRNSKLTRILQDALGGRSVGLLICNLAPGTKFRQDTLNTLNFAVRTKNIENRVIVNERDDRPVAKPHFAALTTAATTATAVKPVSAAVKAAVSRPSMGRVSMVRIPSGGSATSSISRGRVSNFGFAGSSASSGTYSGGSRRGRESILNDKFELSADTSSSFGFSGLTDKEIDERISRAVEVEVARRLREHELQRQREEKEKEKEKAAKAAKAEVPPGLLTPLLKRHRDLDDELKARLEELEKKYERGSREVALADVLSPVSRKKTGRAYVALARAHSEKGDLSVALDLYRKAESYVPDNQKLKERILEIEWAVNEGREFVPSPQVPRKRRERGGRRGKRASSIGFSGDIGDISTVDPAATVAFPQPEAIPATIQEEDEDAENQSDASIVSTLSLKSTKKGGRRRGFFGKGSFLAPIFEKESTKEFGGERTNVELPASKLPVASGLKRNDREEVAKDSSTLEAPIKRARV